MTMIRTRINNVKSASVITDADYPILDFIHNYKNSSQIIITV